MSRADTDIKKQPYHHGNLREALIEAGLAIIDRQGLFALTFRSCARESGVSHGAPAHHLGDLLGLRTAIAARSWQALAVHLERVQSTDSGSPAKRLLHLCQAYVDHAVSWPNRYLLMIRCDLIDEKNNELNAARERCGALLVAYLTALGQRSPHAADLLLVRSAIHGLADLLIARDVGPDGGGPGAKAPPSQVLERLIAGMIARLE